MLSTEQLIKNCQQGKKESQYELVKRYSAMLMTVCRRYARDNASAKDILQETLIKIFSNIEKYQPTGSFEAWMRRIAVRCALTWIDRKDIKNETFQDAVQEVEMQPEIYGQLAMEEIIALIQGLTPGLQAVFNLYIMEGYSHSEIAELLGISESSSRANLTRARQVLQAKINSNQLKKYRSA
jgi:RNA polymerase sigma-70 factor (ECF subfamily)